jgi:hypothetical protein
MRGVLVSDSSSRPADKKMGGWLHLHDPAVTAFLRGQLVGVTDRHAALSRKSPVAVLQDVKKMAAELSEADLCVLDREQP